MKPEFEKLLNDIGVDIDVTLSRLSNNAMLLERVILKFIQDDKLPELEQAVKDWDVEAAERAAHTMKGVSGNLGFAILSDYCNNFVQYARANDREAAVAEFAPLEKEYKRVFDLIKEYAAA